MSTAGASLVLRGTRPDSPGWSHVMRASRRMVTAAGNESAWDSLLISLSNCFESVHVIRRTRPSDAIQTLPSFNETEIEKKKSRWHYYTDRPVLEYSKYDFFFKSAWCVGLFRLIQIRV